MRHHEFDGATAHDHRRRGGCGRGRPRRWARRHRAAGQGIADGGGVVGRIFGGERWRGAGRRWLVALRVLEQHEARAIGDAERRHGAGEGQGVSRLSRSAARSLS